MTLPNELASQFAKVTNDSKKQTEETVYGTVISKGDKLYVNIDGSDSITPIVTTAEIKAGERVAVMIKGHTATVIGNITNPGASTETTNNILGEFDVVVSKIGDFELVVADKVSTDQLEAKLAIVDELLADKATISELNAVKASIEDLDVKELEADLANIHKALIDKAEIKDLDAIHADIDILESDFADIETLVGGNLTMDNMQSLILTSSKVTVDNAFIKDAMIDRVSASKLTAGTINTNMIQIASDDGAMAINGSLQQFKDADGNVRIQIGKDANGDFTFVLYGEDGTGQLINQNGITASAIGDGLIVNDMVADNAQISGDKLDISSVITEINDSSTNIKSSSIVFDDTGQSLSVAFNNLEDTVQNIKDVSEGDFTSLINRMETLTTELDVQQGEIDTLVSNTTITTQGGQTISMKDDYTSTKQTVNSINSKVSSLETTTSSISSKQTQLEQTVGGISSKVSSVEQTTNSLATRMSTAESKITDSAIINTVSSTIDSKVNTAKSEVNAKFNDYYTKTQTDSKIAVLNDSISLKVSKTEMTEAVNNIQIGGRNLLKNSGVTITNANYLINDYYFGDVKPVEGETYTISFKGTIGSDKTWAGAYNSGGMVDLGRFTLKNGIYTLTVKWRISDSANTHLAIYLGPGTGTSTSTIEWIKMEKGNKATDWTPAPEDVNQRIDGIQVGNRNYLLNGDFSKSHEAPDVGYTSKHPAVYADEWTSYNRGVTDATNAYHAHIDSDTFGYNVVEFNESDGKRNWKGIVQGLTERFIQNTTYRISMDIYTTGSGYNIFGGFYYYKNSNDTANFHTGYFTTDTLPKPLVVNKWQRISLEVPYPTDVNVNKYISFYIYGYGFKTNSIVYIKNVCLTNGNQTVDWTPAPEEVTKQISDVEKSINANLDKALNQNTTELLTTVEGLYAKKDTFESFQTSVSSQFNQTTKDIQMTFSEAVVATNTVNNNLETYKAEVQANIRFDANGIELGKNTSPFKAKLNNTKLAFTENGAEIAYISNNKMHITEANIVDNMTIGKFIWDIGTNGNLTLKWSE